MVNPESPQPQSSGSFWKWVGIGCGVLLVGVIATGVGLFFIVKQYLSISFDPQTTEQAARDIIDYQIPGGSQGVVSLKVAGMEIAGVSSVDSEDVVLMVGKIPSELYDQDPAQFDQIVQERLTQQSGTDLKTTSERKESRQLCGNSVEIAVLEGEHSSSGGKTSPAYIYQALVKNKENVILVALTTSGENAKEAADQVLQSLQCK